MYYISYKYVAIVLLFIISTLVLYKYVEFNLHYYDYYSAVNQKAVYSHSSDSSLYSNTLNPIKNEFRYLIVPTLYGPSNQIFSLLNALAVSLEYKNDKKIVKAVFMNIKPHYEYIDRCLINSLNKETCYDINSYLTPEIYLNNENKIVQHHIALLNQSIKINLHLLSICSIYGSNHSSLDILLARNASIDNTNKDKSNNEALYNPVIDMFLSIKSLIDIKYNENNIINNYQDLVNHGVMIHNSNFQELTCIHNELNKGRSVVVLTNNFDMCNSVIGTTTTTNNNYNNNEEEYHILNAVKCPCIDDIIQEGNDIFKTKLSNLFTSTTLYDIINNNNNNNNSSSNNYDNNNNNNNNNISNSNNINNNNNTSSNNNNNSNHIPNNLLQVDILQLQISRTIFIHLRVPDRNRDSFISQQPKSSHSQTNMSASTRYGSNYYLDISVQDIFSGSLWLHDLRHFVSNSNNKNNHHNVVIDINHTCNNITSLRQFIQILELAFLKTINNDNQYRYLGIISNSNNLKRLIYHTLLARNIPIITRQLDDQYNPLWTTSYIDNGLKLGRILQWEWFERVIVSNSGMFIYDTSSSFSKLILLLRSNKNITYTNNTNYHTHIMSIVNFMKSACI